MSLQNVASIDQQALAAYYRLAIRGNDNCLVFGPSGTGKTEIAYQACEAEDVECIYWNLSVTERPDIQGLPRVSDDGLVAEYAAPERLPFEDVRSRVVRKALACFNNGATLHTSTAKLYLERLLIELKAAEEAETLRKVVKYVDEEAARKQIERAILELEKKVKSIRGKKASILFDEVDKAPTECLQPLLEMLLTRRINDRPLHLGSCLLTANLPDEHAHSEPLSHPITNRTMVFQLEPNFDAWVNWAVTHGVHPLFTGFLAWPEHRDLFHKRPSNNEIHCYGFPTPRSWTHASRLAYLLDEQKDLYNEISHPEIFKQNLIASKVGVEAATKLAVWDQYYQKLGPVITKAFEGKKPDLSQYSVDEKLVCLIGASARFVAFAREETELHLIHDRARAVYSWMGQANTDLQVAALRGTCDANLFSEKGLSDLDEVAKIWWEIVRSTRDDDEEDNGAEATGSAEPSQ